ncbi:hypothetical protein DGN16_10410 [Xanthomonas citri pv. fuscans]|uniref:Uncharacterized protein n=1 Tax=Xanthomonas citri pv. phaseoli var. fuscans TaxID=473423 RepID=A0A808FKV6_XANCI|nr:hypothetical protein DGN16_10410 [Xanthomonas citri pv. fuscans]QWN08250.1 hypothetical protein DGN11_13190 [Xanthomonas citri pv. fuscans]QWN11937.1 hypothetical protein DGN07_10555 [Xanthomonas citri pv. fuscans]
MCFVEAAAQHSCSAQALAASCLVLKCLVLSSCFCFLLLRGPIPQRQAIRAKPRRGGAHGCATFFKGTWTSL